MPSLRASSDSVVRTCDMIPIGLLLVFEFFRVFLISAQLWVIGAGLARILVTNLQLFGEEHFYTRKINGSILG